MSTVKILTEVWLICLSSAYKQERDNKEISWNWCKSNVLTVMRDEIGNILRYNRQYDFIGNIISGVIGNIISDVIGNIISNVIGTIISYVRREIPGILYCCWEIKRSLWMSGKRILDLNKTSLWRRSATVGHPSTIF